MSKPIEGSIVRKLRKLNGLTQAVLAEKAKIAKDTVSRLERGDQSGTGSAGRAVAKALGVELAVLRGEAKIPLPPSGEGSSWLDRFTHPLNVRIDGSVRNAYELTALRYRIPVEQIAKIAPLLFVLAAERSLARRRQHLAELTTTLDEADGIAAKFPHLPTTFIPSHALSEYIGAEEDSIAARDILAERLEKDNIWDFHVHHDDYEPDENNPFVLSLRDEAENVEVAQITSFSSYGVDFTVCHKEALNIAGGDDELAHEILCGATRLDEMPDALWAQDELKQRLTWMREKSAERRVTMRELYDELEIAGAESPQADKGVAQ